MHSVLQTPSLQHIALVKIVARVWNQPDIIAQIARAFQPPTGNIYQEDAKKWKAIEEKVESKISTLPLPQLCKKQLLNLVKPLGVEIIVWCHYHSGGKRHYYKLLEILKLPPQLRWSMRGTIDYKKTAELMVKDGRLSKEKRYKVACVNCLEDAVRQLIRFISEKRRQKYENNRAPYYSTELQCLIGYFTRRLIKGDADGLNRPFQSRSGLSHTFIFRFVLHRCRRVACEYFFEKVSQSEIERVIEELGTAWVGLDGDEYPTCGLLFYWSRMNEEQRRRLFRECTTDVLKCLLDWPNQSLFLETAKRGWQFILFKHQYFQVLSAIVSKIREGFQDYDYSQLFWECWRLTPPEYQQHYLFVMKHLESLVDTKKEEFIKLILNEAPSWQMLELYNGQERISRALMDDNVISDAALMECVETAALESSKDPEDGEKKLRSERVSRFVNSVIDKRLNI